MNLDNLHDASRTVSAKPFATATAGRVTALRLDADAELKEHQTDVPAVLVCVQGLAVYEDAQGIRRELGPGDYQEIPAGVRHRVLARSLSQLLLIR